MTNLSALYITLIKVAWQRNFRFADKLQITVVESIIKLRYEIREDLYNKNSKMFIWMQKSIEFYLEHYEILQPL